MDTLCWLLCVIFSLLRVKFLLWIPLTPSSLLCEGCEFFLVGSDVDSCGSGVPVVSFVSSLVLASCDTEMCPDEFWEREYLLSRVCVFRFAPFLERFCER